MMSRYTTCIWKEIYDVIPRVSAFWLTAPVFIIQHLFDEAQLTADNAKGMPLRLDQWNYIHNVGRDLRRTLNNVS